VLAGKRIICGVITALAAALPLAGCGGGGETGASTAGSGEPLTKQVLIAKGDAICKQARTQFEQLQENPPTTPQGAATLTQRLIDISGTELSQLRDLNPPASLRSRLDDYLDALDKNIGVLKQGLKAARQNDATGYAKAQAETVSEQVKRLQLARAVGFQECSRPAGAAAGSASGQ
jgi:hypothetical protein